MSTVDTSSARRFGSSCPLLPILLIGEESSPILGLLASGRERKGSYTSAFPDLCGYEQLHLFLSLLEAPCGRRGSRRLWPIGTVVLYCVTVRVIPQGFGRKDFQGLRSSMQSDISSRSRNLSPNPEACVSGEITQRPSHARHTQAP